MLRYPATATPLNQPALLRDVSCKRIVRKPIRHSYHNMKPLISTVMTVTGAILIFLVGIPLGGFVCGVANAHGNPLIVGIVFAFLTTVTLGFPPKNEGDPNDTYNAWPYIGGTDLVLILAIGFVWIVVSAVSSRRKSSKQPTLK
jgi:hypothetical protein